MSNTTLPPTVIVRVDVQRSPDPGLPESGYVWSDDNCTSDADLAQIIDVLLGLIDDLERLRARGGRVVTAKADES